MTRAATLLLVAALVPAGAGAATESARFRAMGTFVELTVRAQTADQRRAALDAARAVIERLGRAWYAWDPGSELARINRALAAGEPARAGPQLHALLRRARRLACRSGRRFDPTVGGLVRLWGFDEPPPYASGAPDDAAIREWLAREVDARDLVLGEATVAAGNPHVQLELGGIAKGAIVDRALAAIRAQGVDHAMVNAGGDLGVIGRAQGRPWRAGIRLPRGGLLATVELAPGEVLFTSGDYARFREGPEGQRLGHVLDPRTGRPATGAVQASVIARSGPVADAAATALLIAGSDAWPRVAASMGVEHALRIPEPGRGEGDAAMLRRLRWAAPMERSVTRLRGSGAARRCS